MAVAVAAIADWETRSMDSGSSNTPQSANNNPSNHHQNAHGDQPGPFSHQGSFPQQQQQQQQQPQPQQPPQQQYPPGFQPQPQQWTPSPNAAPFYPTFNPFFQQPNAMQPGPQQQQQPQQPPYFDPNHQMAIAYQHMFMQQMAAQQQQQAMQQQFNMLNGNVPHQDWQQQQQPHPLLQAYPFGTGTPPPHSHPHPAYGAPPLQQQGPQFRRPPARSPTADSSASGNSDWSRMQPNLPQAPYARPDAAGSSHSINSNGSSGGHRQRTDSGSTHSHNNNNSNSGSGSLRGAPPAHRAPLPADSRQNSSRSVQNASPTSTNASPSGTRGAHHPRSGSFSSDRSARSGGASPVAAPTTSSGGSPSAAPANRAPQPRTVKPSPLSQQQTFEASTPRNTKRLSRDDSDLLPQAPAIHASRSGGLKGRFKRAMTLNALDEGGAEGGKPALPEKDAGPASTSTAGIGGASSSDTPGALRSNTSGPGSITEPSLQQTKPKTRSLFNGRFNASTDNISLSSTVSSASLMIRKLGSIGKLARKNSLIGITNLFKDKEKNKGEGSSSGGGGGGLSFGRKRGKGATAEASVSMATAEIDRFEDPSMHGLSPAAKLARQHTLKSNAEAAARKLRDQSAGGANGGTGGIGGVPSPWEKDTATRAGHHRNGSVGEDGRWDGSDDGSGEGGYDPNDDDENSTIRLSNVRSEDELDEDEQWAVGLDRAVERLKQPNKSILRNAKEYSQEQFLEQSGRDHWSRSRANSYNTNLAEPGPLAHIPSSDSDNIDGLPKPSVTPELTLSLPPLTFEWEETKEEEGTAASKSAAEDSSTDALQPNGATKAPMPSSPNDLITPAEKGPSFAYTHTAANSSAPVLSTALARATSMTKTPSAPGTGKKISFATNLSIYDTFPATFYDRRSEPATANRLTPALAQRIKEELNSFKMEEMEVHFASRIHTHFFV